MPGIDFNRLRREITLEEVLKLVGFEPLHRSGDQCTGRCPLHESKGGASRPFSVNVAIRRYCCHKCGSKGNQLELWAAYRDQPFHESMIELCTRLGRDVPWIRRW
jgi:DNA primase